ncbi:ganglioside-induced differentiation-associated protein 2 isoform X4 [Papio anubis]|uniref:ganglioside-induced differentiation-associated protein 2 isoform X4 n=1 Tax=Papio anubis TaxID=9555 RepID=UPI0012AD7C3C|nr:ganglioside-induced differentiation-associated protein 2 isoform X4 [Papio anubis]XP_045220708.1 ganglioside-induced differentiation-associated protein 2 isoform X2 [Macaca fascicularis]
MDPLGAPSQFVDVDALPSWGDSCRDELNSSDTTAEIFQEDTVRSPFLYNKDINGKVVLWKGDVALLNCTAIVNTSNESLTDKNPVSESIFMLAGPDLKEDLQKLKGTVRRFLEIHGETIEKVVFAVSDLEEATYQKLLPLYFPRSLKEENRSLPYLPADIGNAEGEPVVPERQIRISEKPGAPEDNQEEEDEGLGVDLSFIGSHAFARMEGDIDKQRKLILQGQLSEAALQKQHQRNYNRWLCQARSEDLSDIASLKALYQTGVDNCGRTVMVVVGRNIPVTLIDMDKALLYFIHVMDHIAVKEYVLVYFHTLTSEYNHLDSDFLKKLYDVVDVKYKRNLKAVYFVHPTFRSKVSTWFFTTFSVSGLKDKIHHVDSLHQLFSAISPEQIDFPPFVLEYDARENGPYYTSYPPSPDL